MAAIHEIKLGYTSERPEAVGAGVQDQIKDSVRYGLWVWFWQHRGDKRTVRVVAWFPPLSVRLWDLRVVVEALLGPCPSSICSQ